MFVTIPTFTIFNKIKVVVRLCGQLAGHECAAARPYRNYFFFADLAPSSSNAACAAARRATGTRYGEQLT
jgi:hypothetical protein